MAGINQNAADQYILKVMSLIHAPAAERTRIEADLKAHLQEGLAQGEDMLKLVERMGDTREVAAEFMTQIPLTYAGFWRRLAGFAIDMLLIILFAGLSAILFVFLSNSVPPHPGTSLEKLWGTVLILFTVVSANACIVMVLAYFPLLEGRFGQTLGKRLLHLRVCTEAGLPIGGKQAILRRLSFYFQILPIDALFILFNPKHQRGFDILARTVVVDD
jgi:uncharacterized RDD family membrane protein YckC